MVTLILTCTLNGFEVIKRFSEGGGGGGTH